MEQYIQNQIFGSLRSKRFQSSYCAKVRAEAKEKVFPSPFPVIHFFFCSCPSFLDQPREETLATQAKFLDELSSQQVVDRLNKFSNACLKDNAYDVDDAVKDLSDVVFSVAEATLPVKSGLPVLKKPKIPGKGKASGFELKKEVLRLGKLTSKFPSDPIVRGSFFVIKKAYKK